MAAAVAAGTATLASAAAPSGEELVERAVAAAGGDEAFAAHRFLTVTLRQKEVTEQGEEHQQEWQAVMATAGPQRVRLQLLPHVVLVSAPDAAWAVVKGRVDERPTSGAMAAGTINESLFPLYAPFSLRLPGVSVGAGKAATFSDGTPAWRAAVTFAPKFFASPSLQTEWQLYVARDDGRVLGFEVTPPEEFREVTPEGVRYRYMGLTTLGGARLPSTILMEGVEPTTGQATAHFAELKISWEKAQPGPGTFIHPKQLEALEEGGPIGVR